MTRRRKWWRTDWRARMRRRGTSVGWTQDDWTAVAEHVLDEIHAALPAAPVAHVNRAFELWVNADQATVHRYIVLDPTLITDFVTYFHEQKAAALRRLRTTDGPPETAAGPDGRDGGDVDLPAV